MYVCGLNMPPYGEGNLIYYIKKSKIAWAGIGIRRESNPITQD